MKKDKHRRLVAKRRAKQEAIRTIAKTAQPLDPSRYKKGSLFETKTRPFPEDISPTGRSRNVDPHGVVSISYMDMVLRESLKFKAPNILVVDDIFDFADMEKRIVGSDWLKELGRVIDDTPDKDQT